MFRCKSFVFMAALTRSPKSRAVWFHAGGVAVTCTLAVSAVASAESVSALLAFDIPAGPLQAALVKFAERTGTSLKFDPTLVVTKDTAGLKGSYPVLIGLNKLLDGTGLTASVGGSNVYILALSATTTKKSNDDAASKPSSASAVELPNISVAASAEKTTQYFVATTSSSATRTDTPISEIAQSVQVITEDLMKSQQATQIKDVLSNVSGVTFESSSTGLDFVFIRGFSAPVSTDGLRSVTTDGALGTPLVGIDHIDVLKGADSILSGQMNPGGVVNVVRKRPQAESVHEVTFQTGSYGEDLIGLDMAGAISRDNHLNYRFIVQAERSGNGFARVDGSHNFYIAPSVGYKTENTDLVIGFEQSASRDPVPAYDVIAYGALAGVTSPDNKKSDHFVINKTDVYYDLKQRLSDIWTLRSKANYTAFGYSYNGLGGSIYNDTGGNVYSPRNIKENYYNWSLEESLQAAFKTGPFSHRVLGGFSYQRGFENYINIIDLSGYGINSIYSDQFPANYGLTGKSVSNTPSQSFANQFYLQDQTSFAGRLHILLSMAHSEAWTGEGQNQGAWSPNAGALYQLTGTLGVYANYLKSFESQSSSRLADGSVPPPSIGKSVEVGIKGNYLDDRLTTSAALFRTAATNYITYSQTGEGSLDPGGNVSRGFEYNISGQILPGWNLMVNYTYDVSKVVANNDSEISHLPKHTARIWTTYRLPGSEWYHGLTFGGGATIQGRYKLSDSYVASKSAHVPGQISYDASIAYKTDKWSATFGIKNITDRRLYGEYGSVGFITLMPRRTFLLTVTHDF